MSFLPEATGQAAYAARLHHWVRFSVAWGIVFYAILQLLGIFSQIVGRGHVSYLGHVGGIVVGICAAGIHRGSSKFDAPAD